MWTDKPGAGINGFPAIVGEWLLVPAAIGAGPELIAYRLPAAG